VPSRVSRAKLSHLAAVGTLLAVAAIAGCNPQPTAPTPRPVTPGSSSGTVVPPGPVAGDPGFISGRVVTEAGMPVGGASIRIVGYTGGDALGQNIETVVTQSDGTYRVAVESGLYEVLGEARLAFDGQTYVFNLDPADASCEQQFSDDGIVKDFVLRLTGLEMCFDGVDPENYLFYHGAPVQLSGGLAGAPADAVVRFTLEPTTRLADGRPGETIEQLRTVTALSTSFGPIEETWMLHDVPLARYSVSATLLTSDGAETPLLVATDTASTPAATSELVFKARNVLGEPTAGYQIPWLSLYPG
jgi:hypothetical protein